MCEAVKYNFASANRQQRLEPRTMHLAAKSIFQRNVVLNPLK
jgi:hypothetical protein